MNIQQNQVWLNGNRFLVAIQTILCHIKPIALLAEEICKQEPVFRGVIHKQDTRRECCKRGSVHGYIVA